MSKAKDLRDQTVPELEALLIDKRNERYELFNKFQREKKSDKLHELKMLRKDIARIMTIIREKELAS